MCKIFGYRTLGEQVLIMLNIVMIAVMIGISLSFLFCYNQNTKSPVIRFQKHQPVPSGVQPRTLMGMISKKIEAVLNRQEVGERNERYAALMLNVNGNDEFLCNMYVLSSSWLLTTGHCATFASGENQVFDKVFVRTGVFSLDESRTDASIDQVFFHPNFDRVTLENNVALIQLRSDLTEQSLEASSFNENVEDDLVSEGHVGMMYGWGKKYYDDISVDPEFREVAVEFGNPKKCFSTIKISQRTKFLTDLCGKIEELLARPDTCLLSEGAVIEVDEKVVGMSSWGEKCADLIPAFFVDLRSYKPWIHGVITGELESLGIKRTNLF